MKKIVLIAALILLPQLAFAAGSQTFTSSGTFTVPYYGSLTVTVNGAGGSGADGDTWDYGPEEYRSDNTYGANGYDGGASAFGGVWAGGGGKGYGYFGGRVNGAAGTASGGSSNVTGGGAAGGAGGQYALWGTYYPEGYLFATNGAGGNGGRATKTYSQGQLTPGSGVGVTVGAGGAGGTAGQTQVTFEQPNHDESPRPVPGQGAAGGNGSVAISWSDPPAASCSVSLSPNPVNQGTSSTLTWSSANANSYVYINSIGYVTTSGSSSVPGNVTTDYSCYAAGTGGSDGWHSAVLTVYQSCSLPWGGSITHGQSTTAYQASTVPFNQSCVSQTRTCTNGSLSGSYTNATCSVTPAASCTQDGATVAHGSSYTFFSTQTAPSGQTCTGSGGGTDYSLSRTCTNGTLSGSSSYEYATCSCTPTAVYSCSPQNVVRTSTSAACAVTVTNPYATCASPAFCSAGSSSCLYPPITFNTEGSFDGHLLAVPSLITEGATTALHWDVENVESCSVTGDNGDSWSTASSGTAGQTSSAITGRTIYTLHCDGLDGTEVDESETVNVVPVFEEQ